MSDLMTALIVLGIILVLHLKVQHWETMKILGKLQTELQTLRPAYAAPEPLATRAQLDQLQQSLTDLGYQIALLKCEFPELEGRLVEQLWNAQELA